MNGGFAIQVSSSLLANATEINCPHRFAVTLLDDITAFCSNFYTSQISHSLLLKWLNRII